MMPMMRMMPTISPAFAPVDHAANPLFFLPVLEVRLPPLLLLDPRASESESELLVEAGSVESPKMPLLVAEAAADTAVAVGRFDVPESGSTVLQYRSRTQ